jgi:prolyl 4-hydroxylase
MNILVIIILLLLVLFVLFYSINYTSSSDFQFVELPNLLSVSECDEIIKLAKEKGLSQSYVVSDDTLSAYDEQFRKSDQVWIDQSEYPVLQKLSRISTERTGLPEAHQEMIQIVRYDIGGKFDAHYDPCVKGEKICDEMNRGAGQRKTTLLVYLNDVMKGGETEFVNLGMKVRPEKGKGILFWSTDKDERILEESKHRGNPVTVGEKWIATIWSHPLPYS